MADDIWYRYIDIQFAPPMDEFEHLSVGGEVKVHLQEYKVIRETPKGVWLCSVIGDYECSDRRFVLRGTRKQFACPTKEQAMESFVARKKAQIRIYTARIKRAEEALLDLKRLKEREAKSIEG